MSHTIIKDIYTDVFKWMPDNMYISMSYFIKTGSLVHWSHPRKFSEKLQWLKLYNRNSNYTNLVDKYEVKNFFKSTIGDEYNIPTIGIWNRVEDIDYDILPDSFVLKCTHDSGSVIVCRNKDNLDINEVHKKLSAHMKRNLFYLGREWPYKNVKPRIICEPLLKNKENTPLSDYKFFCFNGKPELFYVTFGRGTKEKLSINYYDLSGKKLNIKHINYPNYQGDFTLPASFPKMIELAEKVSQGIPFVRADFYDVDGKIYGGEMTFFPDSGWGFGKTTDKEVEVRLGDMIILPEKQGESKYANKQQ